MIPIFSAYQAASPLIKAGSIMALVVVLYAGYLGWKEYQQSVGAQEEYQRQLVQLAKENEEAKDQVIKLSDIKQRVSEELSVTKEQLRSVRATKQKEINRYAATQTTEPCVVSPQFVRVFDAVSGVQQPATPSEERVPTSNGNPEEPEVQRAAAPSLTAVLRAYEELKHRYDEDVATWKQFSEFDDERYRQELEFYNQQVGDHE